MENEAKVSKTTKKYNTKKNLKSGQNNGNEKMENQKTKTSSVEQAQGKAFRSTMMVSSSI